MNTSPAATAIAFLSIKTQFDNLGDALINRELCLLAADRVETFVDFSRAPASFRKSMQIDGYQNLRVFKRLGFLKLLGEMLRNRLYGRRCVFFLNPGGLGGKKLPPKSLVSAMIYNVLLGALRCIGVRICQVGISFDPLGRPERFVVGWRRRLLHSFTVRDRSSFDYLNRIGIAVDELVPDLSFNLCTDNLPAKAERGSIAFSFRFDGKAEESDITDAVHKVMKKFGASHEYLFVVQVARDEAGMRRLHASCIENGLRAQLFICHDNIDELSKRYLSCKAIFSNRLHALLLAAHSGASPYAMISRGKQPKIEGMFNDLGIQDRLLFLDKESISTPVITPFESDRFVAERRRLHDYFDRMLGPRIRTTIAERSVAHANQG